MIHWMFGTILNVGGILVGGAVGLVRRKPLPTPAESYLQLVLAVFTVFSGLRLTWLSLGGTPFEIFKEILILVFALMLGKLTGRLLGLQQLSNRLGRQARERLVAARPDDPERASEGFKACAALFCAAPLGILGAVQDGLTLSQYFYPLAIKAVIDGVASIGFVSLFGWGVLMAALPVLAFQGTISLVCLRYLEPLLSAHNLLESVNAVGGLLVFCVALVMLGLKRVQLADYLPSLLFAPLLTSLWL